MSRTRARLAFALLAPLAFALAGCPPSHGDKGGDTGARRGRGEIRFPVEVETVAGTRVDYEVNAVGTVSAFETVHVTAGVAGIVTAVKFKEGDLVVGESLVEGKPVPGTLLVEIDPERFRIALDAATATQSRAIAEKTEAEEGLRRRETATARNSDLVTEEEVVAWRQKVAIAVANKAAADAALALAKLNLRRAEVRAPLGGRIETRTVQTGQYVDSGDVLATLVRREPLLLRFNVPDRESAALAREMGCRFRVSGLTREFAATILHVAQSADVRSRMVAVTAEVVDAQRELLRAGAFAEVRVPVGGSDRAVVIPQTAVRPSQRGFLAYVVTADETAEERVVLLGLRTPDGRVEVRDGIKPGETVVIRGGEALRTGLKVRIDKPGQPPADEPARSRRPGH